MPRESPSKFIAWCDDCKQFVGVRQDWNVPDGQKVMWRRSVHRKCLGSRTEVHPNNVLLREVEDARRKKEPLG